ncbi:DUF2625 family protein [Hamadaea sp. NPDC051192]|uniref:DUF2625 family protein n=1 Tax=Hamadaea sp. NPDC051192 TaxID=3154940 RepID=UPI003444EC11
MRSLDDLITTDEPAWPDLSAEFAAAESVHVLPVEQRAGEACLVSLQVTVRSRLGAMARHTGGVLVDDGWVRVYGGGSPGFPSLADMNQLDGPPPALAVGHDVVGGLFEVNGPQVPADRPGSPGEVCYFAPDTLGWESLGVGYGDWLSWLASGATHQFYDGLRWSTWRAEIAGLRLDQGFTVYPFLCTTEARADMDATTRSPAPIAEVIDFTQDLARQLTDLPDGGSFALRATDA